MAPGIKQDLNRAGWETTDFPSVCEPCLPDNPYVQMIKENYGAECKLCTRPFTFFTWKSDRASKGSKSTNICLTCARLKNCCQCCMLDLQLGLPLNIRDAALKMVAPGANSAVNREYFAQNNEKLLEEGKGLEEYEKTEDRAKELLKRLANSEPYRRRRAEEEGDTGTLQKRLQSGIGPIRTSDTRGKAGKGRSLAASLPQARDILPPRDPNVTSLFATGVDDDLPEHQIRKHFAQYGTLRSVVCSHRAHAAFINYATREAAEQAAAACQGKAVVAGCPLRVSWGKPKALDNLDDSERMAHARAGRDTAKAIASHDNQTSNGSDTNLISASKDDAPLAAPPGQDDVQYASLAGD
ncbi:MAG: hypothetical protein GOMPHAMPRED_005116 [Gomphillus americanus]|uniref:RRM domain-containing protein n=1 Tax=Gomphillus americanus TaxID=1940652 RepID=A0A8H3EJ29_9LECA|nr:MAG: hypothetical protein GOMPHAMPRED_005116 [Gomphillus americanus]